MTRILISAARVLLAGTALAIAVPAVAQHHYQSPPPPGYYPPPPPQGYYPPPPMRYEAYEEEEIVVDGRYRRLPNDVQTASQRVSYRDLDLYYPDDRRELRRRVSLTARFLCDRLGESDGGSLVGPSCRDAATRDALRRVGTVAAGWAPRGTAWIAPPRWRGPYPVEWEQRYR